MEESRTLLSINNYYYPRGGAETVFLEHNRLLRDEGWRVVPFSMRHPKNLESRWAEFFVDEIELGRSYSFGEKLERASKVIYSFEARRKLNRLLASVSFDICHLHNIYHHLSPSILGLLRRRRIPAVLTVHDLKMACPAYTMMTHDGVCERCKGGRLGNVIKHRCIKGSLALSSVAYVEARLHRFLNTYVTNVDRFVIPSRFCLDKLAEWGMPRDKLVHIPNFVDADKFEVRRRVDGPFLYFGRLSREKGAETLVRAAAVAKVPLRIAGTGPEEGRLRALAERLGARVEFLGHLGERPLKTAIAEARATVLPSECYENAPMSVLESYASGVPVVGADIGGIGEMIREETTGLTFPSGSVDALAERLRWFSDATDGKVLEMGQAARAWVDGEFTRKHYRGRMRQLYAGLGVGWSTARVGEEAVVED